VPNFGGCGEGREVLTSIASQAKKDSGMESDSPAGEESIWAGHKKTKKKGRKKKAPKGGNVKGMGHE